MRALATFLGFSILVTGIGPMPSIAQDQPAAESPKPVDRNVVLMGPRYKVNELLEKALLAEYPSAQVRREGVAVVASAMTFSTGPTEIGLVLEPMFVEGAEPTANEAYRVKIVVRARNNTFSGVHIRAMQAQLDKTAAAQSEVRVVTDDQSRITSLERASGEAQGRAIECYKAIAGDSRLDPIREKVSLTRVEDQSFVMLTNRERPQEAEKAAILVWGTLKERCDRENLAASQRFAPPAIHLVRESGIIALRNLTVSLYQGDLSYGDFAKLRQENANLTRSALANVDRELKKESEDSRLRAQSMANQSQQILIDAARVEALNRANEVTEASARRAPVGQTTFCNRSGTQIICQTN